MSGGMRPGDIAPDEFPARARGTLFKNQQPDAKTDRKVRQKDDEDRLLAAYAEVNVRDESVCWVTGIKTFGACMDDRLRREHHHLKGRRVKPEWKTRPERIICVSALAHHYITIGKIRVTGDDARQPIYFSWDAGVKKKERVLVIQASRLLDQQRKS